MVAILELIGFLGTLGGLTLLSQATMGVGVIGASASLLILARLLQADRQHKAIMAELEKLNNK